MLSQFQNSCLCWILDSYLYDRYSNIHWSTHYLSGIMVSVLASRSVDRGSNQDYEICLCCFPVMHAAYMIMRPVALDWGRSVQVCHNCVDALKGVQLITILYMMSNSVFLLQLCRLDQRRLEYWNDLETIKGGKLITIV